MQFLKISKQIGRAGRVATVLALSLCCVGMIASGQSTDITAPAPVRTSEVLGSIVARDIGDPRATDHYYSFTGTPGDLLITIDSRNLNGDVDVFTSSGLRPLLKLTVYASNSSPVSKSVYLRKRESLILRVEGRTPNDDEGTYRLSFGGSFEPITSEGLVAENESALTDPAASAGKSGKKGRRVSSVGARIEEPPSTEAAAAPTPETSRAESSKPEEARTEETKSETRNKVEVKPAPARTARARRPTGRRTPAPAPKEEPPKSDVENSPRTEKSEAKVKPPPRERPTRKDKPAPIIKARPIEPAPVPESGPRLMIETSDGTLINRFMSSVRRVVVEKGQVVVTGKDGKVERIPLESVVRMSISP